MSQDANLIAIPIGAAEVMTNVSSAHPALYLPSDEGRSPLLYRQEGARLIRPNFRRLKAAGVSAIYVRGEELTRCEEVLESHLSRVLRDPSVPSRNKAACVQQVGVSVVRELLEGDPAPESLDRAANLLDLVIENVLSQPGVAGNLLQMSSHHQTTASHMFAVSTLAILLGAEVLGDDELVLRELGLAGMLHDLGKLQIDAAILNKATPLTVDEVRYIQQHPIESVRLLPDVAQVGPAVRQMILQHHERYDGAGYPLGLRENELLTGSRILAIVDSFHAMIGRRDYKRPITPVDALNIMKYQQGRQFDPACYAAWARLFRRCWTPGQADAPAIVAPSDHGGHFHRDHRIERPASVDRVHERRPCDGRVRVRCWHAGRLSGLSRGTSAQQLVLLDLSKGGLCIHSREAMYRGEVLHLSLQSTDATLWVRGAVAWCRRDVQRGDYKVGVRLVQRIAPGDVDQNVPVLGMGDPTLYPNLNIAAK